MKSIDYNLVDDNSASWQSSIAYSKTFGKRLRSTTKDTIMSDSSTCGKTKRYCSESFQIHGYTSYHSNTE